jgi:hypothetical protein
LRTAPSYTIQGTVYSDVGSAFTAVNTQLSAIGGGTNPQSVFRLLLADRDIAAGVYPMKNFKWPAEGVPAGTTQKLFEDRYGEYPFNPIDHGASRVSPYVDDEGFVEVAEAPTGFMAIKRATCSRR